MHDVINDLFVARDLAHKFHLQARTFAMHLALDELYTKLTEKIDEFAEVYQGQYGVMNLVGTNAHSDFETKDALSFIRSLAAWVKTIPQYLKKEDTHLLNLWDEITTIVYRAKYKVENLW